MLKLNGSATVGSVTVVTTQNTGLPVEHWAEQCLDKIVYIADNSDSLITQQARAFKDDIRKTIYYYMAQAIKSDRTTLYNLFVQQGHGDIAEILRRI